MYGTPSVEFDASQSAYWDTQLWIEGTTEIPVVDPNLLGGTAMSAVFTRTTPVGTIEDQAQYTVHYVSRPGPVGVSDQLSTASMTAVEVDFLSKVWNSYKALVANTWTLQELVWRDFGADFPLTTPEDPLATPPVHRYGPVRRRVAQNQSGVATAARMPDQVACSVTFRTGSRKHWGRVYLGGFSQAATGGSTTGRWSSTNVDLIANAFHSHFQTLAGFALIIEPVVWSSRYAAIMSLDSVQVDDVPDVIRRRRPKQAAYRKTNG